MTEIVLSPEVSTRIIRVEGEAGVDGIDGCAVLHEPALLVIDGWKWPVALSEVSCFRELRERTFDSSLSVAPRAEVAGTLRLLHLALDRLFDRLYGRVYGRTRVNRDWRPLITRNEPLHFDTRHVAGEILITAFLNVADTTRDYGISHTLPWLCKHRSAEVRKHGGPREPPRPKSDSDLLRWYRKLSSIERSRFHSGRWPKTPFTPSSVALHLRDAGMKGRGPQSAAAPRHRVRFASGSVWFFDPQRVSHEVVYGECAVACGWPVAAVSHKFLPETDLQRL